MVTRQLRCEVMLAVGGFFAQDIETLDLRCPMLDTHETHVPRVQQAVAPPPPKEALMPIAVLMKVRPEDPACIACMRRYPQYLHQTFACYVNAIQIGMTQTHALQGFSHDIQRQGE